MRKISLISFKFNSSTKLNSQIRLPILVKPINCQVKPIDYSITINFCKFFVASQHNLSQNIERIAFILLKNNVLHPIQSNFPTLTKKTTNQRSICFRKPEIITKIESKERHTRYHQKRQTYIQTLQILQP